MAIFDTLTPRPADPLLGLMAAFREDTRDTKIDLGVGVYRNEAGVTPIMEAVRLAELRHAETSETKVYESPRGNLAFVEAVDRMVFGDQGDKSARDGFSSPGGCGALMLANALIKRTNPDATLWISDPSWPNHPAVAKSVGLATATYPYAAPGDSEVDMERMLDGLGKASRGDAVIIQGPCHNPTGIDLGPDDWKAVADLCISRGILPLIDIAYHGLAYSLDEDIAGVRAFLDAVPDALISYSCSKNFGLYRDRTGCLLIKADSAPAVAAAGTHVAEIARTSYSMPPAHGQALVATILGDADLTAKWKAELAEMRERINTLRADLADSLHPQTNSYDPQAVASQRGMFSQLPLSKEAITALREEHGIYMPGSGRINIAGLDTEGVARAAKLISPYL